MPLGQLLRSSMPLHGLAGSRCLPFTRRKASSFSARIVPAMLPIVLDFLAPEMYWYGWTASAAIGALAIGLLAALLPDHLYRFWAWCVWVVPPMAMIVCVYLTIPWFRF
jgi:hypothetical protein